MAVCEHCKRDKAVTIESGVKVRGAWVRWRLCVPCELAERRGGDVRVEMAIAEAERTEI